MLTSGAAVAEITDTDAVAEGNRVKDTASTITAVDLESGPAACQGNLVVFTEVAEQCRAQLLWQARRMTNSREEAEDIVQEALLKAFKNLPRFRGESQMGTWLTVIVLNTGREWLRRRKGRIDLSLEQARNRDDDTFILDLPDPGRNPEQWCERGEMDNILLSEIDKLNSVCKGAIQLCAIEQLSHQEIADMLGINVFTIKSRVFHGKRMLRRAIRERTSKPDDLSPSMEPVY